MDIQLLDQMLADRGEPRFRARQVWAWAARGALGYEDMTDIPSELRQALARELPFSSLTVREQAHSHDGTIKALFATADGRPLEAVLMSYRDGRRSICVSCQSGCPLTCRFCATGSMPFARNLTASEILEQALHFRRMADSPRGTSNPAHRHERRPPGADHPLRVHGHGRADAEPRRRARRLRAPAGHRRHPSPYDHLHGGLDPRHTNGWPSATCRCAWRCRCTRPRIRCAPS